MTDDHAVRVRGIYATALTRRLGEAGLSVVQASPTIRDRFDADLPAAPADATVETTADREGVLVSGDPDAVAAVEAELLDVAVDALAYEDPAPRGAVFDARVVEELGSGAVVDLGDREGYLPYAAVDGHVSEGDAYRLQVHEPAAGWTDDRPLVGPERLARGGLATLRDDREGTTVRGDDGDARELAGMADLVDVETPPNWGVEWGRPAIEADLDAVRTGLERAVDRARDLIGLPDDRDPPRQVAAPEATAWVWFGRDSRFALDDDRGAVTATMPGHHRVKAGDERASTAVDFLEAAAPTPGSFPFGAVTDTFGPREGDRVTIEHGKPDGRSFPLGRAEVVSVDGDGSVTVRREFDSTGSYDALGTEREPGDTGTTRLKEGRWWYATKYVGEDGTDKGLYGNVCTPVEVFPDCLRYVDLHVDVVKYPDGRVERVDDDELDAAVEAGDVPGELADRARAVASKLEDAL